jgi:hypothetical protein
MARQIVRPSAMPAITMASTASWVAVREDAASAARSSEGRRRGAWGTWSGAGYEDRVGFRGSVIALRMPWLAKTCGGARDDGDAT